MGASDLLAEMTDLPADQRAKFVARHWAERARNADVVEESGRAFRAWRVMCVRIGHSAAEALREARDRCVKPPLKRR